MILPKGVSETQFYILVTAIGGGLGGIGMAIRFSVGRIAKAIDKNSDVMLRNTEAAAVLATKIDGISNFISKHVTLPPPTPPPKRRTPAHGTREGER